MSFSSSRRHWRSLAGVGILIIGAGAVLSGQSLQGGAPSAIDQILAALTRLQKSVDALAPPPASTVRATPAVFVRSGVADCVAANVSSEARSVKIEMINGITGAVYLSQTSAIASGAARSTGVVGPNGTFYCRFTVLN